MPRNAEPVRTAAAPKSSDRQGPAPAAQPARCLGPAAQLASIRRTLAGGLPLQLKTAGTAPAGRRADAAADAKPSARTANRTGLPDRVKAGVEALSGLAMDDVRVHRDSAEPAKLGALAYTQGSDIHLGPGQEQHLPHEAWHVVQQKQGRVKATTQMKGISVNEDGALEAEADRMGARALRADPPARQQPQAIAAGLSPASVVQRRRIPSAADLNNELPAGGAELVAARPAVALLLARAWADLNFSQRTKVRAQSLPLLWWSQEGLVGELSSANRTEIIAFAERLRQIESAVELGDVSMMETGARPGTSDSANLQILFVEASKLLDGIIGGGRDVDLGQVFGVLNIPQAKGKYAAAKTAGGQIIATDRIISDRSGFSEEAGLGGYFAPNADPAIVKICLRTRDIDNPRSKGAIITFIHECAHAGSPDVGDHGYIGGSLFTRQTEEFKLKNAAHFEVVPRRMIGHEPTFAGETFLPAAAVPGGGAAVALTVEEEALQAASEAFRKAWDAGVEVHYVLADSALHPEKWYTLPAVRPRLLYWSLVEELTIHKRHASFPAAQAPGVTPVTHVDLALSEGLVRKLAQAGSKVPDDTNAARDFERDNATRQEKAALSASPAATRVQTERDLLVTLVLRKHVVNMTGSAAKDKQVVDELEQRYEGNRL